MRIDELIQELEKVKKEHGNLKVKKEDKGIIRNVHPQARPNQNYLKF